MQQKKTNKKQQANQKQTEMSISPTNKQHPTTVIENRVSFYD
jgi:hypothetical protein